MVDDVLLSFNLDMHSLSRLLILRRSAKHNEDLQMLERALLGRTLIVLEIHSHEVLVLGGREFQRRAFVPRL